MKISAFFIVFITFITSAYAFDPDSLASITIEKLARTLGTKYSVILEKDQILDEIFSYNLPDELAEKVISETIQPQGLFSSHSGDYSCTLVNGGVWCWGLVAGGKLDSNLPDSPIKIYNIHKKNFQNVRSLSLSTKFVCALLKNGTVWCGDSTSEAKKIETDVISIYAGYSHHCAVKGDGTVWCWEDGEDKSKRVLFSNASHSKSPVKELALGGHEFESISFGLMEDGTLFRWSDGGRTYESFDTYSAEIVANFKKFSSISASDNSICLLKKDCIRKRAVYYKSKTSRFKKGDTYKTQASIESILINFNGGRGFLNRDISEGFFQLQIDEEAFEEFDSEDVKLISLGSRHACVLKFDSTIECVGGNDFLGHTPDNTDPTVWKKFEKVQGFDKSLEAQIQESLTRLFSQGKMVHFQNRPTLEDVSSAASYFEKLGNYAQAAKIFKTYSPNDLYLHRLNLEIKAVGQDPLSNN
jgi:alpha-tubulin suppressor-like RCC1 family protein